MTFTIDTDDLDGIDTMAAHLEDVLDPITETALEDMADAGQASVRAQARRHRRTGRLDRNIRLVDQGGAGLAHHVTVKATGMAAPIIVKGSRPHAIRPLAGGARALWIGEGAGRLVARVQHPGTRPDPFVARGLELARDEVADVIDHAGARAVSQLATIAEG